MKQIIKIGKWRSQQYLDLNRDYLIELAKRRREGEKK